jgi:alternate signal-mediated exported protein
MTINPTTERERRSRRLKGLVAGAAGIALLLGGSTFAMWSDSDTDTAGTIKHGTLDVTGNGTVTAYDLRVAGAAKAVTKENVTKIADLGKYLAVPGDQIEVGMPVTVTATGDNMEFNMTLAVSAAISDSDWTLTAKVYKDGAEVASKNLQEFGTAPVQINTVPLKASSASSTFDVVVLASLRSDLGEGGDDPQLRINGSVALGDLTVGVQQVTI